MTQKPKRKKNSRPAVVVSEMGEAFRSLPLPYCKTAKRRGILRARLCFSHSDIRSSNCAMAAALLALIGSVV